MTTFEAMKSAIEQRKPVSFKYKDAHERIGNPYAIFVQTNDRTKVHIVQTAGYTEHGELNAFKPFNIEDLADVTILADAPEFLPDHPHFKPDSSYYSKVIAKV